MVKRSKFWTVAFSLIPGAGHMFMGFLKTGVSFMLLFMLLIFISNLLGIGSILIFLPVLWCYSFFDAINKRFTSDEAFAQLKDEYLFVGKQFPTFSAQTVKSRKIWGITAICAGVYLVLDNLLSILRRYDVFSNEVNSAISFCLSKLPSLLLAVVIIVVGVRLILGKKKELDSDETSA